VLSIKHLKRERGHGMPRFALLITCASFLFAPDLHAQSAANCSSIKSDKDRLACFDATKKDEGKASSGDDATIAKTMKFIRTKFRDPRSVKFGSVKRSMRSNGHYEMDVVCGFANGMGFYYWVEKNDGGIDDGSMVSGIGYKTWCG
jgi:hypothetical protein